MCETTFAATDVVTHMQSVSIIVYCSLAVEFLARYTRDQPVRQLASDVFRGKKDERLNRMLQAMLVMTAFIVIRYLFLLFLYAIILILFVGRSTG